MRRILAVLAGVAVLCLLASCSSTATPTSPEVDRILDNGKTDDELGVAVSPQNLILGSNQGGFVVVHTFIPYTTVSRTAVTLNYVPSFKTKADDCGNLVAYFKEDAIKAIVDPPDELMTLRGEYTDGEPFEGSDTVMVKVQ
jgi:hypothetical protein